MAIPPLDLNPAPNLRVFITGGATGIGRATAEAYAARGARGVVPERVLGVDRRGQAGGASAPGAASRAARMSAADYHKQGADAIKAALVYEHENGAFAHVEQVRRQAIGATPMADDVRPHVRRT